MRYIAHRGLINGPDLIRENHPDQIMSTIMAGYDCEIDVRCINDEWWLGHDGPTYKIDPKFLDHSALWIHCKNHEAFLKIADLNWTFDYSTSMTPDFFWHQEDDYTITNKGVIWAYPGRPLNKHSVCVQPERFDDWYETTRAIECYGICSKYVEIIRNIRT